MPNYRHAIVTLARWETSCILEWLAYHRSIGFDHVYLYCNDDDPTELFDQICPYLSGDQPFVTFNHYPVQGRQWEIYLHWFRTYTHETKWASFLDIDEFLALPGTENIALFMEGFPADCDAVQFHWIYYGNNGFLTRPPGSVLRQYTRREAKVTRETKTMVRPHRIDPDLLRRSQTPFWHMWDDSHPMALNIYNSLGQRIYAPFEAARVRLAAEKDADIKGSGFIAHFAIKSVEDFQRRVARGLGGNFAHQQSWADGLTNGKAERYLRETNAAEDWYLKFYWERLVGIPEATSIEPGGI